jgi:hypothetical protein
MIQILGDETLRNGVELLHIVKKNDILYWSVKLPCGHKQLARHSDLAAEIMPQCIECAKVITQKASGVESGKQFADWAERRRLKPVRPRPVVVFAEEMADERADEALKALGIVAENGEEISC